MQTFAPPQPLGEAGRWTGVWAQPAKVFEDVGRNPECLWPLALILLTPIALFAARLPPAYFSSANMFAPIAGILAETVVRVFAVSALAWVIASVIFRAPAGFAQVVALYCYSSIPVLAWSAVNIAILAIRRAAGQPPGIGLTTNLAALLNPHDTSRFVFSIAASLDLFALWRLALFALGLRVVSRTLSMGAAIAAAVIPWALYILVRAFVVGR